MLKIRITGASGYLGKLLVKQLSANGHDVLGINRNLLYGSPVKLKDEIKACDVVVNFAGAPILKRWTKKNKSVIYNSRVETTKKLVLAITELPVNERPSKFISASAIGIYNSGEKHTEDSTNFDPGFVANVVKNWENALNELPDSIQKNKFRIGMVLGKNAKTIKTLIIPFKLGLGAILGNGKQAFPFIHEKDVVRAFVWAIENHNKSGVFNLLAPTPISNRDFTKTFAREIKKILKVDYPRGRAKGYFANFISAKSLKTKFSLFHPSPDKSGSPLVRGEIAETPRQSLEEFFRLNRPAFLMIPAFVFKLFLGETASLLLKSPVVKPKALLEAGFKFKYPDIESTLSEILA